MSDIVTPLLEYINLHPQLAGLVTFLISAGESVAIIGTIVPGSITMTAIGALAGAGIIPLWPTLLWAIVGAIVGDGISYWFGHYFKKDIAHLWPFRTHPKLLKTGEAFFHRYGGMSVFIGRFVGPVRALVPLVAGMLGMRPMKFFVANTLSAIGWAPAYMLPGIFLGAAALELPPDIAIHVVLVLIFAVLLGLLCLWFLYQLLHLIHHQTEQFQDWLWRYLKKSRYLSVVTWLLHDYDPKQSRGQLRLALHGLFFAILFLILVCYVKLMGPAQIGMNNALLHLSRGIRNPSLDNYMLDLTLLGEGNVVLPVIVVIVAFLFLAKRYWTGWHALALGLLALNTSRFIKEIVRSPRPWGMLHPLNSFSMPSGHTTLATTVYMGLAFLIANNLPPGRRWPFYLTAGIASFLVGVSRIYLNAHWFTDVLSAWFLSAILLIAVIISFRQRREKKISPVMLLAVSLIPLIMSFGWAHHTRFQSLQNDYEKMDWPVSAISMTAWWKADHVMIPSMHTSLFGFPSQAINIEWTGSLTTIRETLLKAGWFMPKERDLISIVHRLADISSDDYLPMISPQYLDKKPQLVLVRYIEDNDGKKKLLILRLWDSNCIMSENKHPLWVGTLGAVPRTYSWLSFHRHAGDHYLDTAVIFSTTSPKAWQWKTINIPYPVNHKKIDYRQVLLLKDRS
jgi:undecaprenyl-diphosphatase